jgi:hypothetical protein
LRPEYRADNTYGEIAALVAHANLLRHEPRFAAV